jgi:hypothetical protein
MAGARLRGRITVRLGRLGAATAAAGRRALVVGRGETARRLGRLAALTVLLAVLVVVLYDHGDVPTAAARSSSGGAAGQAAGAAGGAAAAGERPPRVKRSAKPAEVAAAWYAARHKLPRSRVRPLQQDRVSAGQVRVLVLADAGNGKLRTALVRVRLGPSGWEVR